MAAIDPQYRAEVRKQLRIRTEVQRARAMQKKTMPEGADDKDESDDD